MMLKRIVKKQSKKEYKNAKTGKSVHYYNYFLELENNKRVQIKPAFTADYKVLDTIAEYESNGTKKEQ